MTAASTSWTDDRIADLRRLWRAGATARAIAGALGQGATRNSVLGKLNRLGLLGERLAPSPAAAAVRQLAKVEAAMVKRGPRLDGPARRRAPKGALVASPVPARPTAPEAMPGPADGIDLSALTLTTCRWPIAGSGVDMRYCGARTTVEAAYCPACASRAYAAPIVRKARR